MTVRARFLAYLVAAHLVFAASAAVFLYQHRLWLLAVELFFVYSLLLGIRLMRALAEPAQLIESGVSLIESSDFQSRFQATGKPELDRLVTVYNRMVDNLRQARVRNEEQQLFLERLLEASTAGVVTLDLDDRISDLNDAAARLLGVEPACARGASLGELDSGFARALAAVAVGQPVVLALGGPRRVRCQRLTFPDRGFRRPFLLLVELTDELRRSEKAAYDKLIRMLAHEVNNTSGAVGSLLASCLNYRRHIAEEDRDDFVSALAVAQGRTENMNRFIERLAAVVRVPRPEPQPTDLRELVTGVHVLVKQELATRSIRWQVEHDDGLAPVALDRALLEQVLLNVVKNAWQAVGCNGAITVRTGRRGRQPYLEVRDTGGGIAAEAAAQLFTPFYTSKPDGEGVGLTLVQEILLAHGFEFTLTDTGDGAAFTVLF